MQLSHLALGLMVGAAPAIALPSPADGIEVHMHRERNLLVNTYVPVVGSCPAVPLVRAASTGIAAAEASWVAKRKLVTDAALARWMAKTSPNFAVPAKYPTLALASGGGGLRAFLTAAGVHQAMDALDSSLSTSGLYQAMTYESGLSSTSWMLGSITGNGWPTISSLQSNIWGPSLANGLLNPGLSGSLASFNDPTAKNLAGYPLSALDPFGRILSYNFLASPESSVNSTWSSLASSSKFAAYNVPLPIVTARGLDTSVNNCVPSAYINSTQYEYTPFEFGSWDAGVASFVQMKYLGTNLRNGQPAVVNQCVTNFDNQGYVMASSTNIFNEECGPATGQSPDESNLLNAVWSTLVSIINLPTNADKNGPFPNPFYMLPSAPLVSSLPQLGVLDGGEGHQIVPVWPMLQRDVDVLFMSDNSEDTADTYPSGMQPYYTYTQARARGNTRMPFIPAVDVFVAAGLNKRPVFFGCNTPNTLTLIYLPLNSIVSRTRPVHSLNFA